MEKLTDIFVNFIKEQKDKEKQQNIWEKSKFKLLISLS